MTEGLSVHPGPERLAAFRVGNVSPEELTEIERHLADCPCCCRSLKSLPDDSLVERVERLLAAYPEVGSCLEPPPHPTPPEAPRPPETKASGPAAGEGEGLLAGRYQLLEQIGEGGMGSVWMARQAEPVKRLVAVKLIKPGMDSRQVLARFEAERQALALMDHPNIATVLDAGSTPDGRPFFVMELVKGVTVTKYCDEHKLTPRQRLELFVPVCQAIQHAHQKGVIHRDIKPSNVLVALYDGKPVPKVIDFGVAKATGPQLTEQTLNTGFGAVVGTVEYMSPEQASFNQLDVDTRSDVYALGVLLYELLAGSPPFSRKHMETAGLLETLRVIREQEPPKPSRRLSTADGLPTLAANRGTEPKRLTALVRGELDWMVMKALEKDRNRRYETASAFAADVQRYLNDEPVQACPPSAGYWLRKFARRNKRILATAALLGVMLLVAVGAMVASALWAADQAKALLVVEAAAKKKLERNLYFTHIALAEREQAVANWGRAEELLDDCPEHLRGWEWHYLKRLRHAPPLTLALGERQIGGTGFGLDFSPDGGRLATCGGLEAVQVWDTTTGRKALPDLRGHADAVRDVAFSPDGRHLATASVDMTVKVWNAATGEEVCHLKGHTGRVSGVAFSPDGRLLAAGDSDQKVKLWDWAAEKEVRTLSDEHTHYVFGVAFSPDGRYLASASWAEVIIWDLETDEKIRPRGGLAGAIRSVAFSLDGQRLAVASGYKDRGEITIWDAPLWKNKARGGR